MNRKDHMIKLDILHLQLNFQGYSHRWIDMEADDYGRRLVGRQYPLPFIRIASPTQYINVLWFYYYFYLILLYFNWAKHLSKTTLLSSQDRNKTAYTSPSLYISIVKFYWLYSLLLKVTLNSNELMWQFYRRAYRAWLCYSPIASSPQCHHIVCWSSNWNSTKYNDTLQNFFEK